MKGFPSFGKWLVARKPWYKDGDFYCDKRRERDDTMVKEGDTMKPAIEKRKSGIPLVGDLPWGTHFCQFYQTKKDLLDMLIPYFRAGLENNEFCLWVTSDFLTMDDALKAMGEGVPGFSGYLEKGQIEILSQTEFYLKGGKFDAKGTLNRLAGKYDKALSKGFAGMRGSGNSHRVGNKYWNSLVSYEAEINSMIGDKKLLVLCTYSAEQFFGEGATEILDVVKNHRRPIQDSPVRLI